MLYDAVTLDTNIFVKNAYHLEGGLLGQLTQFHQGSAKLVLSEIVWREVRRRMEADAKKAGDSLETAIKKSLQRGLVTQAVADQLNGLYAAASRPDEAVRKRLEAFAANTGASIVAADETDIKKLIKLYFDSAPPFEATGDKKSEFPDAIALLSLEQWAKANNKKVLAISEDLGWLAFAKATTSGRIEVESDLATALQKLQQHAAQARTTAISLLASLDAGKRPDLRDEIARRLELAVSELDVSADADSTYSLDADLVEVELDEFEFVRDDAGYDVQVVQVGKDKIVARIGVAISGAASCDFSLSVWDSVDREAVPMGSAHAKVAVSFECGALVTFEGPFAQDDAPIVASGVELVDAISTVDFGEIDFDREYYEDDEPEGPDGDDEPEEPDGANEPEEPDGANEPEEPDGANEPEEPDGADEPEEPEGDDETEEPHEPRPR